MKKCLIVVFLLSQIPVFAQILDIQGHRGARGLLPENTIPAFIRAIDERVTTLELDVVITKDKKVIISHEPFMSSTICSTPQGRPVNKAESRGFNIYQMTYDEVKTFDCGSRGNALYPSQERVRLKKPLLSHMIDTIELYLKTKNLPLVNYNIEIKSSSKGDHIYHPGVKEFSELVFEVLNEKLAVNRYNIQSFDFRVLRYWHHHHHEVPLAVLVGHANQVSKHLEDLGFVPDIYSPNHVLLRRRAVSTAHRKGMKVIPWTVNSSRRMKKLIKMGADGIITDYPDKAKRFR